MAEVVNLNRARKARARQEATRAASENRVKFGRTKARKAADRAAEAAHRRAIDQAKLES